MNSILLRLIEPMQNANKLKEYRRKLGMHHAFVNVSNKAWLFLEEDYEIEVLFDMEQQLTLRLFNPHLKGFYNHSCVCQI